MNTRKVAAFALVVGLAWPLQAQTTVEAVQATVVKIKSDAQSVLDYNADQNWKRKLPFSVTESAARTIANANYAMVQLGTLRGAPPPLPASAPVITTSPASQSISSGATASMAVSAVGNPAPTYQWYVGSSGTTTAPIGGATSSSYTTGALTTTTSYWVRVTNASGSADSATAVITVSGGAGESFTRACTTNVAATNAAIDSAVSAAAENDVLCIAAGTITITTPIEFGTKSVTLRGAGSLPAACAGGAGTVFTGGCGSAGQTIIYTGTGLSNSTVSGFASATNPTVIENIKFTFNASSSAVNFGIISVGNDGGTSKPFLIRYNDFEIRGVCSYPELIVFGSRGGIVSRNRVDVEVLAACNYVNTSINFVQHIINDNGSWWDTASTFGSADTNDLSVYVERNYVSGLNVAVDQNTSSRMVWRFNEMHSASLVDHGYDSSTYGNRQWENYGNRFFCDTIINLRSYIAHRGGTGFIFDNIFDAYNGSTCDFGEAGTGDAIGFSLYKLEQAEEISAWPGIYAASGASYPMSHQLGWGNISGSNQTVGSSSAQNDPGGAGFQQALEPAVIVNNTFATTGLLNISTGYTGAGRLLSYTGTRKATGTTVTASAYMNVTQDAVVACTDLIGGSALTISDGANTFTALTGGTNGSLRLSAWRMRVTTGGYRTVTITSDSSASAIACVLGVMRGVSASGFDLNPAVVTDNVSPYDGPLSGTLTQANEVVIGYFGLQGPTVLYTGAGTPYTQTTDTVAAAAPDTRGVAGPVAGKIGIIGTTGGVDDSNVTAALTYRVVTATTSVAPRINNTTSNRTGLAGTVTFKITNGSGMDLQTTDFLQANREYYSQVDAAAGSACVASGAACSAGAGSGTRVQRPANCTTGVYWWSNDQGGNWNTLNGSANDGTMDKCTATNTWTNAVYTPKTYPHTLANP